MKIRFNWEVFLAMAFFCLIAFLIATFEWFLYLLIGIFVVVIVIGTLFEIE